MNIHKRVFSQHMSLSVLVVKLLVIGYDIFIETAGFPKCLHYFTLPLTMCEKFSCSISSPTFRASVCMN